MEHGPFTFQTRLWCVSIDLYKELYVYRYARRNMCVARLLGACFLNFILIWVRHGWDMSANDDDKIAQNSAKRAQVVSDFICKTRHNARASFYARYDARVKTRAIWLGDCFVPTIIFTWLNISGHLPLRIRIILELLLRSEYLQQRIAIHIQKVKIQGTSTFFYPNGTEPHYFSRRTVSLGTQRCLKRDSKKVVYCSNSS